MGQRISICETEQNKKKKKGRINIKHTLSRFTSHFAENNKRFRVRFLCYVILLGLKHNALR